ncbi:MAG TPA: glycoside hydrolase [Tepidisphaeraceae bacterium]|jgi:hypothetical protein|nr:glycoside hydrolase [Tepidisphaeraceae bacterium]
MILTVLLALRSPEVVVSVDPGTLAVVVTPGDTKVGMPISAGQQGLGEVAHVVSDETSASWSYPEKHVAVSIKLEGETLVARFVADAEGSFTFPTIPGDAGYSSYLLPIFEGFDVPTGDAEWIKHLSGQDGLDTTADLSMPVWGIQTAGHTVTFLLPNQFGNELGFHEDHGRLAAALTHRFKKNWAVKEYSVRVTISDASVIAPALVYRKYLQETKQFVSLAEKIKTLPDVGKLIGAAEVYLWGGGKIAAGDVTDFKGLAGAMVKEGKLYGMLTPEVQKIVKGLGEMEYVDQYTKGQITEDLSRVLGKGDYTTKEMVEGFGGFLKPVETWGDGVSVKMIRELVGAGLDRMRLVVSDVQDLRDNPGVIGAAEGAGYLIGPYDSFNSIHRMGDEDRTTQFDQHLYDTGGIVNEDGKVHSGFQHKGHLLSPAAGREAVEARVTKWFKETPCNCWFVDCDAFGQVYDDFSTVHPATAQQDMAARLGRMAWIRNQFHCVIGSEGGSSYAAGVIDFAEGPETPGIGWGDVDMQKDKTSAYYLGAYYPPNEPAVFFKPVALKASYLKFNFDPRYRVPLYQAALHDSVVATHHWSFGSFKLKDLVGTREMLELLYGVPPLYHLNVEEFGKRREEIVRHYAFFSPLHREVAEMAMTGFDYLSEDHLVQRTVFGGKVEVVANFSDQVFMYRGQAIPGRAVAEVHPEAGGFKVYQSLEK